MANLSGLPPRNDGAAQLFNNIANAATRLSSVVAETGGRYRFEALQDDQSITVCKVSRWGDDEIIFSLLHEAADWSGGARFSYKNTDWRGPVSLSHRSLGEATSLLRADMIKAFDAATIESLRIKKPQTVLYALSQDILLGAVEGRDYRIARDIQEHLRTVNLKLADAGAPLRFEQLTDRRKIVVFEALAMQEIVSFEPSFHYADKFAVSWQKRPNASGEHFFEQCQLDRDGAVAMFRHHLPDFIDPVTRQAAGLSDDVSLPGRTKTPVYLPGTP